MLNEQCNKKSTVVMECAHFTFLVFVVAAQLIFELLRLTFVLPPFAIFVLLFFSLPKKKKKKYRGSLLNL